jgi:hypothetical protein
MLTGLCECCAGECLRVELTRAGLLCTRGSPSNLLWIEKLLPQPDNAVSFRWQGSFSSHPNFVSWTFNIPILLATSTFQRHTRQNLVIHRPCPAGRGGNLNLPFLRGLLVTGHRTRQTSSSPHPPPTPRPATHPRPSRGPTCTAHVAGPAHPDMRLRLPRRQLCANANARPRTTMTPTTKQATPWLCSLNQDRPTDLGTASCQLGRVV